MRRKKRRHLSTFVFTVFFCGVVAGGVFLSLWLFGFLPGGGGMPLSPGQSEEPKESEQPKQSEQPPQSDQPEQSEPPPQREQPENPQVNPNASGDTSSSLAPVASQPQEPQVGLSTGDFAGLYYYEADKADDYARYSGKNPSLSDSEVVWHVNAGLGGVPYEDYEAARNTDSSHYIVNKFRKLPDSFEPKELVSLGAYRATPQAAAAYFKMQADARAEGYSFSAISAYRSIESQRNLYNGYLKNDAQEVVDTYSARPGFSEHHTGRAIDLAGSSGGLQNFVNTPECAWVHKNAYKYGFILRYPDGYEYITGYDYEPWHVTYVGEDIAADMRAKGISTLEEYTVKYVEHKG